MGALVSLDQRDEVRKAVQSLRASADVVFGDPDHVDVVDGDARARRLPLPRAAARAGRRRRAARRRAVRPGRTVIGYDSLDEAVDLAARGRGSLVASVVTHDADVARTLVLGLAPWHGRILVLDRDDAGESTGHGSPLPHLVHGGPGRAGGGEELGGVRGVLHHLQRTAVQGSPDMLTAVTGVWTAGSRRSDDAVHPFRKASPTCGSATRSRRRAARSPSTTSTTSPSSPATPSTPTPTRRPRRRTRCSAASSPTATSWSRWPPGSSCSPTRARCSPTSASTGCASSPRSRPATRSP